jgi:hypothetical protein
VTRATTSVLVALLLVFVLFGGPCLVCATVIAGGLNHGCCHPKKGCQEHPPGSLADCISPAVGLAKVEQASALVFVSLSVIDQSWNLDVQPKQSNTNLVLRGLILHSPPDLCLLNSVLTI